MSAGGEFGSQPYFSCSAGFFYWNYLVDQSRQGILKTVFNPAFKIRFCFHSTKKLATKGLTKKGKFCVNFKNLCVCFSLKKWKIIYSFKKKKL